jgi:hypothetical protein
MSDYGGAGPVPGALAVVDHWGEGDNPCPVLAGAPAGIVDLATLALWRRSGAQDGDGQ